jgi:hypothetical protein
LEDGLLRCSDWRVEDALEPRDGTWLEQSGKYWKLLVKKGRGYEEKIKMIK